jgi:2,5-diamino-6-(ribosylamino)-4(3H)-pyrimidinone 5'-phosphate reductase
MGHNSKLRIMINAAMTVDGKIATICGDAKISSRQDLRRVHKLRASVDGIIVGISTVIVDDPLLTVRLIKRRKREDPARIIVDSEGRIPLNSKILRTASRVTTIIVVSERASTHNIQKIRSMGATVITAGKRSVNLREAFLFLQKMGLRKILAEGGGELNWSLFKLGIVEELIVTISPKLVGGRSATTLVEGEGYQKISEAINLRLNKVLRQAGGELVLFYKV